MIRTKKFFSVLLALVMVLALLPVGAAHATDDTTPTTCTVSFDSDGGSGSMDPVTVTAGTEYTLPENGFTAPEGKEFDKWDLGDPGDQGHHRHGDLERRGRDQYRDLHRDL